MYALSRHLIRSEPNSFGVYFFGFYHVEPMILAPLPGLGRHEISNARYRSDDSLSFPIETSMFLEKYLELRKECTGLY